MHQVGEIFIETVTEVAYDPVVAEASDQVRAEDPIHLEGQFLTVQGAGL